MKIKRKSGFTLAEMLLTVAIITVLLGVSFVAFMRQQRSMTRLEYDSIAKEIFVAAQNHLTAAESQGYLQLKSSQYGTKGSFDGETKDGDLVWYVINNDSASREILNLMLPNYALDGAALTGSYIIRYQPSAGLVLDVFYSRASQLSFLTVTGTTLGEGDYNYNNLMENCRGDDKRDARNGYGNKNAVIGWYGNEDPVERGERLAVPSFEIINAEQLLVNVNDPNNALDFASLKLIVTGNTSKAEKYFSLVRDGSASVNNRESKVQGTVYSLILDDITFADFSGTMHFYDIVKDPDVGEFLPGEDITVKVVAYSNTKLANIAMSDGQVTNSLYADPKSILTNGSEVENGIASIANIRHLENLDDTLSKCVPASINKTNNSDTAKQITDLSWTDFKEKTDKENTQIRYSSNSTDKECFYPVSPNYALIYDGQNHVISDVNVNFAGNAGMFGTLSENGSETKSEIKNLKLIDFTIKSTGTTADTNNAGALVGSAANTTITNVVAYNSVDGSGKEKLSKNIEATGAAGGLIGTMNNCTVTKSAAALYVNSTGTAAGGLIGSASSGTVTACYSGGHTYSGAPSYDGVAADAIPDDRNSKKAYPARYYDANNNPMYNVSASVTAGTAGGLIGSAGSTTISGSYSTCSASGATAGGFVGTGGTISNSYCTGLVSGTNAEGAFSGSASTGSVADNTCKYFEIINERRNKDDAGNLSAGYTYLTAFPNGDGNVGKIDGTAADYQTFSGDPKDWIDAEPYDSGLITYYQNKYNLKPVSAVADDFVAIHHGDWPAPEEFIFN